MKATRVAVVGAGWFAAFHAEAWRELGVPVAGVADIDLLRARALADRVEGESAYADASALLAEAAPTLVDVVLPPPAQRAVVEVALERGLPVICQKPFGATLAAADAMTALAAARGVPLVVHENFRFTPWFRECRRLVDSGFLGRVHGATFRLRPGDGQGARAYLDRQPSFRTMPEFLVRETGIHFIDCFRFLLGEVRAVTARLRRLNAGVAGEDAGLLIIEFDDARTALFDGNRCNDHSAADARLTMGEFWLEGEAGVLRLDGDARLWWKPHHEAEREHAYERRTGAGPFGGAVAALQAHVLAHLHHGAPLENTAADYQANLLVQAAAYHSHRHGIRVPLATFVPEETST